MASSSIFSLCFLVLLLGYVPQARQQQQQQNQCQLQRLNAVQPSRRTESEAGVTEHWDENDQQLQCAGVAAVRHTIRPRGLLLPHFTNAPQITYVIQGRAVQGAVIPGCPETYESAQQSQQYQYGQSQKQQGYGDRHQKIKDLRQGDIVALPAGIAHWFYNDGDRPLILVSILHTASNESQLDQRHRAFYLAGNPQQGQSQEGRESEHSNNIFQAFDDEILAEAFGVRRDTVRKLKSENDMRGSIVRVQNELQFVRPPRSEEEEQEQQGQQGRGQQANGIDETFCTMRYRENIGEAIRADIYNPQAGRIRSLNSGTLPILGNLQLSVEHGVLYRDALMAPHWNLNANSVIYVTRGSARIQVVGNYQSSVFNGQVRQGQLLIVPQNFAVVKQAGSHGFEWVAVKTNDNAMSSPVAGKTSALAAMPVDVLINAYRGLSREEAMNLKNNRRRETLLLAPSNS